MATSLMISPGFCWELLPPGHRLPEDPNTPHHIYPNMFTITAMAEEPVAAQPGRVSGGAARAWGSARCLL